MDKLTETEICLTMLRRVVVDLEKVLKQLEGITEKDDNNGFEDNLGADSSLYGPSGRRRLFNHSSRET